MGGCNLVIEESMYNLQVQEYNISLILYNSILANESYNPQEETETLVKLVMLTI